MTQQHWLSILDALHGNIWALPPTLNVRNKLGEHAEHMQFQSTVEQQMYGQYDWHLIKNSAADERAVEPAMPSRRRHRLQHRRALRLLNSQGGDGVPRRPQGGPRKHDGDDDSTLTAWAGAGDSEWVLFCEWVLFTQ